MIEDKMKVQWTKLFIYKAKQKIAAAMFVLSVFLEKIGIIKAIGPIEEQAIRFKERYLCFEPCIYTKKFTWDEMVERVEAENENEDIVSLSEAKNMFLLGKGF